MKRTEGAARKGFRAWTCALAAAATAAASAPAVAGKLPVQLEASFDDPKPEDPKPTAPTCAVSFVETVDERRSPETLGVIGKRAVRAPENVRLWMQAVLAGLNARGVRTGFNDPARDSAALSARFRLQTAWIAQNVQTYDANVVVTLEARDSSGSEINRSYRGRASRTTYWSAGAGVMQKAVDGAFADALDDIAADLKALCRQQPPAL